MAKCKALTGSAVKGSDAASCNCMSIVAITDAVVAVIELVLHMVCQYDVKRVRRDSGCRNEDGCYVRFTRTSRIGE